MYLAKGFSEFQNGRKIEGVQVHHVAESFGRGIEDIIWIPKIAQMHGVVITQDLNIHRTRYLFQLCLEYKLGIFFFKPPKKKSYKYWEWIEQVLKRWALIKDYSINTKRPFSYLVTPNSVKPQSLN
ncbi:MAG: hypothetical protein ACE5HS_16920 [bacterium]